MSTLLISEVFPPRTGGSGRWFWEIYSRLPRDEYVIAAGTDGRHKEFDNTHDLRLVRLPLAFSSLGLCDFAGLRCYLKAYRELEAVVRGQSVTYIHCGKFLPEGLLALALWCRHRIPFACYCHGEDVNFFGTSRELSWLIRRIIRSTDFIIANSRNTQRILFEDWQVAADHVRMLHPGVDVRQFHPAPPDPAARAKLGWDDRPVILTVGRLQKRKGHDQLILALHEIRKTIPNILYAVMGDGEERSTLGELVKREGLGAHVMLMGERHDADLVTCYQQCDLFALPNRQIDRDIEGFGMVLLEAQACGKPVVAGQSGGTAETMRIPDTGMVVPCNGPQQLAELVIDLFSDRDRMARMGAAGRQWVVENFDWAVLSQNANRLFTESRAAGRSHKNANGSRELVRLSPGERAHRLF